MAQQIERFDYDWMPSEAEAQITKHDEKYDRGPVGQAGEGALEQLALDNAQHAETADKADRASFRRAATSYTNALIEYRRGVRPERLQSDAWLLPSRRARHRRSFRWTTIGRALQGRRLYALADRHGCGHRGQPGLGRADRLSL